MISIIHFFNFFSFGKYILITFLKNFNGDFLCHRRHRQQGHGASIGKKLKTCNAQFRAKLLYITCENPNHLQKSTTICSPLQENVYWRAFVADNTRYVTQPSFFAPTTVTE